MRSPADSLPTGEATLADRKPPGDETASKKGKGMSDAELSRLMRDELEGARNYRDTELVPIRTKVQAYFEGDINLDGDLPAREKRSKFVSRDVRDVFGAIVPQLVNVLLGNDEAPVEFEPVGPEDVDACRDATQYIYYLLRKHGGDELFIPVIHDALKSNVGAIRYWWEEKFEIEEKTFSGISDIELEALQTPIDVPEGEDAPEIEIVEKTKRDDGSFDCKVKIKHKRGQICLDAIPPEERLIDENARSLRVGKFRMWAHARSIPVGELVAMGYDEDEVEELDSGDWFLTNDEAEKRENAGERRNDSVDPTMREVPYAEAFVYGDIEGDGFPGLFFVCVGGSMANVLKKERVTDIDVAEFQTVPVEHVATGTPYLANVIDVAALRTVLWRGTIDSLAQTIFPQRGFLENKVSVADLMNDEPGGLVRCGIPPAQAVVEFPSTFAGADALRLIQYTDQTKEERTGVSRNSAGMDPDALQSVSKEAAASVVNGAQMQIQYVARILANYGGMKALFKGILRLLVKYQKFPERVRLHNGQFVNFDPRKWNPDMDCRVRTGLGNGTTSEKIAVLDRITAMQEKVFAIAPEMVYPENVYNVAKAFLELTPYRDASRFFVAPPPGPPKPKPQPPSPEMILAEIEKMKAETMRRTSIEKNQNERLNILLTNDRERDKNEADFLLGLGKLLIDAHLPINIEQIKQEGVAAMQRQRSIDDYMLTAEANASAGEAERVAAMTGQQAPAQQGQTNEPA